MKSLLSSATLNWTVGCSVDNVHETSWHTSALSIIRTVAARPAR